MFSEIILHDTTRPLAARLASRKHCGPYRWRPAAPNSGRGFYCDAAEQCGVGTLRLRLEDANAQISGRLARTTGYYCDPHCDGDTLQPIIARLPRGRGFLAGWKMGPNMCATLGAEIFPDEACAAYAAHSEAENTAERERDYRETEDCE